MKESETFVYAAKKRRRTVRVIKVNRVIVLIMSVAVVFVIIAAFFALNANETRRIEKKSYYYLQMGQFTSSDAALGKSAEIKNIGGCGYIINDGEFRVMAAVYSLKSDAEKVRDRLNETGKNCGIYEMKVPSVKLRKYADDNETKAIRALLVFPSSRLFPELQKQDMLLDGGETTDSAALLAVQNLKKETSDNYAQIIRYLSGYPADATLGKIEKMYFDTIKAMENYLPKGELKAGTNIKSTLCALVEIYVDCLSGAM